jgi:hypothetical protein
MPTNDAHIKSCNAMTEDRSVLADLNAVLDEAKDLAGMAGVVAGRLCPNEAPSDKDVVGSEPDHSNPIDVMHQRSDQIIAELRRARLYLNDISTFADKLGV